MKYLFAYSIPVIGMIGIYLGGLFSYAASVFAFVKIPLLEIVLPNDERNYDKETISQRLINKFFDV